MYDSFSTILLLEIFSQFKVLILFFDNIYVMIMILILFNYHDCSLHHIET